MCFEFSIQSSLALKNENLPGVNIFVAVDSFARLIVLLIKEIQDTTGDDHDQARLKFGSTVLSLVNLVLVNAHEKLQTRFDQRPFFRFYSSILNVLKEFQMELGNVYYPILSGIRYF